MLRIPYATAYCSQGDSTPLIVAIAASCEPKPVLSGTLQPQSHKQSFRRYGSRRHGVLLHVLTWLRATAVQRRAPLLQRAKDTAHYLLPWLPLPLPSCRPAQNSPEVL